ncbi:coiled-coil domain-containing protein 14 isoform X1 [Willisornis vidua]|uniref:Coiled-coil domain-containing protein 14 isoform X1 n=1 Tax=Willisornis vidua TaxID=1566151 RepID=A0ABQ9CX18_9PASS|nr:coiled-coil domain-containing protein 14 isoform X1 [Willisornis vidua]
MQDHPTAPSKESEQARGGSSGQSYLATSGNAAGPGSSQAAKPADWDQESTRPRKAMWFGLRKGRYSDVDFYSTDSDNQVDTIHNGLEHCAALLKNVLQNETTGRGTVHKQPGKITTSKITSKPLLTKGNSSKRKGLTRNATSAPVQKEIVPISNRKFALSTTPSAEKELSSAAQNQMVQAVHVPCSHHSPVMHEKLCEHVQTQMSLITGQPPQKSNEISAVTSNQGSQNVTAFNYRLPTSTSALSLQHSADPLTTQSGVPVDSANDCVPEKGGPLVFPVVSTAPAAQGQSAPALPSVVPCITTGASIPTVPTLIPAFSGREMTPSQEHQIKEADLIRCIQAHLALLQSHEMLNGRTEQRCHQHCPAKHEGSSDKEDSSSEEHSEDMVSEDELNVLDIAPARDTSCKTSCVKKVLKSRKENPEETAHKVKTVKYLMGELRELVTDQVVSLQSLNMMLQSQLKESQKGLDSLQAKNEELLKIIESQKEENKHLAKVIQDKEEELLENKQHYDIHSTKLKIEVEEALGNVKSLQFKLEASEKENKILAITLRQRDAEVKRLRELTRTLQGSMAKLLSDLTADSVRPKPEKGLSKSLLEDHEKQMQPELFPGSTSVMTYLKKLEMDHILVETDLQLANKSGEVEMQNLAYEKFAAEGSKINSTFIEEGTMVPRTLQTSLNQDAETISDSGTVVDYQNKLDETIYIPLTSSASKKQQPGSERSAVLPQGRGACKTLDYCELPSSVQHSGCELSKHPTALDKVSAGCSVGNTLEVTGDKEKPEGDKVRVRPKVIPSGAAKDFADEPDQPQPGTCPHVSIPFPTEISQRKGSKPPDFSCNSFDDLSGRSEWSASSFSTFTSRDEEDFKNSLAALDANIARLQRTLQRNMRKQ